MKEMTVPAKIENIEAVTEFVNEELKRLDCSDDVLYKVDIAIDELFGNIARYAYQPDEGPATVKVDVLPEPLSVILTFIDNGLPFNPLERPDPDVTLSVFERTPGGLGIYMVRNSMDEVTYEYKDGQNVLTIRKRMKYAGPEQER